MKSLEKRDLAANGLEKIFCREMVKKHSGRIWVGALAAAI